MMAVADCGRRAREMERANACTLPEKVCGTNVPLKTIKPGDPLWELTMLGRHGRLAKKKEPVPEPKAATQSAKSKDDVPEWAQDDALADASITDDSFLGTALPQLTEEERLGLAGLSVKAPKEKPPKTSRSSRSKRRRRSCRTSPTSETSCRRDRRSNRRSNKRLFRCHLFRCRPALPLRRVQQRWHSSKCLRCRAHRVVVSRSDWTATRTVCETGVDRMAPRRILPERLAVQAGRRPPQAPFMPLIQLLQSGWRYRIPMQQAPPQQQQQQQIPQQTQPQQAPPRQPPPQRGGLPPWLTQQEQPAARRRS